MISKYCDSKDIAWQTAILKAGSNTLTIIIWNRKKDPYSCILEEIQGWKI